MNWASVCTWPHRGESLMQCPLCHCGCAITTSKALLTAWAWEGAWVASGRDSQPRAACASPAAHCIQPYKQPTQLLGNPAGLQRACPSRTASLGLQLQTAMPHQPQKLGYVAQPVCPRWSSHSWALLGGIPGITEHLTSVKVDFWMHAHEIRALKTQHVFCCLNITIIL